MTAGRCPLVLRYWNTRSGRPGEGGQRLGRPPLEPPQEEFVPVLSRSHFPYPVLQGPRIYLKGAPILVLSDRSRTIAPDENPGSPSPEMKPREPRGWTGRLTRSVLSEAGGHLSRDTCSTPSSKPFPGKQVCPGRTRRAKGRGWGWEEEEQAGGACRRERQAVCLPFVQASHSKSRLSTHRLLLTSDKPPPLCLPAPAGEVLGGYADGQQGALPWHRALCVVTAADWDSTPALLSTNC